MNKIKNVKLEHVSHPFAPVFNSDSKILILGSMPSVKSRELNFYYSHPRNRFWKVISHIVGTDSMLESINDKKDMLLKKKIAIWDVIKSCKISGSSDSSIKDVKINDINLVISNSKVKKIYANGMLAYDLYMKYCFKDVGVKIIKLPSTSPANATYSIDKLINSWMVIYEDLCYETIC